MQLFIAAISLGLLGGFHCIGMCGPIALALPVHTASPAKKLLLILIYNSGRIASYTALGVLAGLLGKSFSAGGYQQFLSVIIGILLLMWALMPSSFERLRSLNATFYQLYARLKSALSGQFANKGIRTMLTIGILNGLLPCGLVYVALSMAVATGDVLSGTTFMALFGAGTIPVMLAVPYAGRFITGSFRSGIRKAMRPLVAVTALLLIIRGLNLGIPYMSPKADSATCHQSNNSKIQIQCTGQSSQHNK
jgi:sulfite exporter TauE/SafE